MNRAIKREQEKQAKKRAKKNELNSKNTGLSSDQLKVLLSLMTKARDLYNAGDKALAEKYCIQILKLHPKNAEAYNLLGGVSLAAAKYENAKQRYLKAIEFGPNNDNIYVNYSLALKYLDLHEEALAAQNKALKLNPKNVEAMNNKGSSLLTLGKLDEARTCFETALKIDPSHTRALLNIGGMSKYKKDDENTNRILAYENHTQTLSSAKETNLQFALGKCHEDLENFEQSMSHYVKANSLKWDELKFDSAPTLNKLASLKKNLSDGPWTRETGIGCASDAPIFIVGMPRSGTTLVEQILDSHSEVHGAGERKFAEIALNGLAVPNEIIPKNPEYRQALTTELERRGAFYLEQIRKVAPDARHIADKMPLNFKFVGLLHLILPNAKIIHCKRNPVDTCLSNYKILFAEKMEYSYKFEELGKFYLAYKELTDHWDTIFPGKILSVQYEDVVQDVEGQAKRIIDHCDLEWEPGCLDFYKSKRVVHTASVTQVRQPIYNTSVGKWQRYGDAISPLLDALKPVLD